MLESQHRILRMVTLGFVDMDKIQKWVYDNLPKYNWDLGVKIALVSAFVWFVVFVVSYSAVLSLMAKWRKTYKWAETFWEMTDQDKKFYTSYIHAMIHAGVSTVGGLYSLFYADGKPGTSWFHDSKY